MNLPLQAALMLSLLIADFVSAQPTPVKVVEHGEGYRLTMGDKPFKIKGAGGDADRALLADSGGNTLRTWGIGDDTQEILDEAQANGLKVALGIWLGHVRHGFDYNDPAQVQKQFDDARAAVVKYKDHPALLLWGVGNEMEGFGATTDPKVWEAVNAVAEMIKEVDPNHPTMTVIAEIGGDKLESIERYCPAIDIVGINSYGGVMSIPDRYAEAGLDRPYVITEFGPPGTWEQSDNDWGVPIELTSTEKAAIYREAYERLAADPNCLGSFAFLWGSKQEATATWFGMFLPDGTKLGAVDAMTEAWTGQAPANLCPRIERLALADEAVVSPGAEVRAELRASDPEGQPLRVEWVLFQEMTEFETGGDYRPTPPTFPGAIATSDSTGATVKMPDRPGNYRLFAYVRDGQGGGAVANVPLRVEGKTDRFRGQHANLPLIVYGDGMSAKPPYIASGYMGNHGAIQMNEESDTQPHSGETCLAVTYDSPGDWGGVAWQNPPNDWGDMPGGYDLSGAQALTFYARGDKGGEKVKFGFGLIGRDKSYYDTAKSEIEIELTTDWQRVEIPLTGKNLACIKSGFFWTLAGNGSPIKFYLDDIVYTDTAFEPQ